MITFLSHASSKKLTATKKTFFYYEPMATGLLSMLILHPGERYAYGFIHPKKHTLFPAKGYPWKLGEAALMLAK